MVASLSMKTVRQPLPVLIMGGVVSLALFVIAQDGVNLLAGDFARAPAGSASRTIGHCHGGRISAEALSCSKACFRIRLQLAPIQGA